MCGRLIFVFIRVLFVYTDNSVELCSTLNLMQCYMEKTVVKKEAGATGQQFAELLCDFMFKRVFTTPLIQSMSRVSRLTMSI